MQSLGGVTNSTAYVTSKHAALGLVRSIALDFAPKGIRAHCVCPGAIDTPMLRWAASISPDPAKVIEACEKLHLFRRLGTAAEVARVIAFLASDDASFMTGQPVLVDGGCMVPIGGASFIEGGQGARVSGVGSVGSGVGQHQGGDWLPRRLQGPAGFVGRRGTRFLAKSRQDGSVEDPPGRLHDAPGCKNSGPSAVEPRELLPAVWTDGGLRLVHRSCFI